MAWLTSDAIGPASRLWDSAARGTLGLLGGGECGVCRVRAPSGLCGPCAATLEPPTGELSIPGVAHAWALLNYAHARDLVLALATHTGLRCRRLLRRVAGSPPRHGRSAAQRRSGPVFRCVSQPGPSVLVVDDVMTTGGTIAAAARALRARSPDCVVGAMAMTQSGWSLAGSRPG